MIPAAAILPTHKPCHPERSLAVSKANRQAQSKDPYPPTVTRAEAGNFHILTRSVECEPNRQRFLSRVAAIECSPRHKPWGIIRKKESPEGAKENAFREIHAVASI